MKRSTQILILILLTSCFTARYATDDFCNQTFVCDHGQMVGETIIQLKKDTFIYSERGNLFVGKGVWSLSQDKKTIHLKGSTTLRDYKNEEFALRKNLDMTLKIKNKKTLASDDEIFIKQD